jgi:hypothetical protein
VVAKLTTQLRKLKSELRDTDQYQDSIPVDDVDGMGRP